MSQAPRHSKPVT